MFALAVILLMLLTLAVVVVDAHTDKWLIARDQPIKHLCGAIIRALPLLAGLYFAQKHIPNAYWVRLLGLIFSLAGLFWLAFDACLNYLRGLPLDYATRSPRNFHDRLLLGLLPYERWITRGFLFVLGLILLIIPC